MNGNSSQITKENNGNSNRSSWLWRVVVILVIIAIAPLIIGAVALFVSNCVQTFGHFIDNSISSFSYSLMSGNKVESITKLCLWLLVIIIVVKFLVRRRT